MKNDIDRIKKEQFKKEFKKRVYKFILELIKFIDKLDKKDPTCRVISDQLVDSGTGILSNYLEAQVASSKKDFINYFHHSLKCCNESKMWIAILRDSKKANFNESNKLLEELKEISNILASSLLTLKGKK